MKNFKEAKMLKERGITPKSLLNTALKNSDEIENIVVVIQYDNKSITTGYSYENSLSALGMLDIAKDEIKYSMND